MPEISRFLGVVVAIYYRDHEPAHFHALRGAYEITVEIESGKVNGRFPRHALRRLEKWRRAHKSELLNVWQLARSGQPLPRILPME